MSRGGAVLEAPPPEEPEAPPPEEPEAPPPEELVLEELVGSSGFAEALEKSRRLQALESLAAVPESGGQKRGTRRSKKLGKTAIEYGDGAEEADARQRCLM